MAKKSAPATAGKGKKFCSSCNEVIGARAQKCPHCGTVQTPKSSPSPRKPAGGSNEQIVSSFLGLFDNDCDRAIEYLKIRAGIQEQIDKANELLG